jgi:hypothetical protein
MPYQNKIGRYQSVKDTIEYQDLDEIDIIIPNKRQPDKDKLFCVYCETRMEIIPNILDVQWLCPKCGAIAKQGLGDTPVKDTTMKHLATPNNPYPTELDSVRLAAFKEIKDSFHDDMERDSTTGLDLDEQFEDPSMYDVNRRTGMQWRQVNRKWVAEIQEANKLI